MKKKIKLIAIIVVIIAIVVLGFLIYRKNYFVDTKYIHNKLEKASELTTAKLTFTGITKYSDDGIYIINRADFTMVYKASVRIGIDLSKVKVDKDVMKRKVIVTIPNANVLEVHVDPSSIEYYDTKFALLNFDSKKDSNKDSNKAQAAVEDKAKEEVKNMGVLEMANEQAETLIKGILEGSIPDGFNIEVKKVDM